MVDAAMNDLIRPALYRAHHEIIPLRKNSLPPVTADVVGPVCETGDFLARDRDMANVMPGDFLAVCTAGAYGSSRRPTTIAARARRRCWSRAPPGASFASGKRTTISSAAKRSNRSAHSIAASHLQQAVGKEPFHPHGRALREGTRRITQSRGCAVFTIRNSSRATLSGPGPFCSSRAVRLASAKLRYSALVAASAATVRFCVIGVRVSPGSMRTTRIQMSHLHAQRFRKPLQRKLRRTVHRLEGNRDYAADRPDVHEIATALLAHYRKRGPANPECAEQVDVHLPLRLFDRCAFERSRDRDSRVVHHNIDPGLARQDRFDGALHRWSSVTSIWSTGNGSVASAGFLDVPYTPETHGRQAATRKHAQCPMKLQ